MFYSLVVRLNKFIAQYTSLSRRSADAAIASGRVKINSSVARLGALVFENDKVWLDNKVVTAKSVFQTVMLNKPQGYVCSKAGQGSKTIYDLLPGKYHHLNPVGRLDKDSSGLILLTNDGQLANKLAHPRYNKSKTYLVTINKPLQPADILKLKNGVALSDGISKFSQVDKLADKELKVVLSEGRNRQIRRTLRALGYNVQTLHRISFGEYELSNLKTGSFQAII